MKKIAFLDTVHDVLQLGLEELGWQCDDLSRMPLSDVEAIIHSYQGIVIRSRFPMNEAFLKHATQLEFIARSGAGMENIDIDYCNQKGVILFNSPEGNRNAVAEHALGMLLSLFNQLKKGDQEVRQLVWDREGNRGVELDGRTVGIIGYGNNGSAFAQKLKGFDVKVLANDLYKSGFGTDTITESSMDQIFEEADVVSLHIPQTSLTKGMINRDFIQKMRNPFYLINLSRGAIVNTTDLVEGIETGKVLGACLDVLEYEKSSFENMFQERTELPAPFTYILNSSKVLLSPHVGGWTNESYYKLSDVLLQNIKQHYLR